MKEDFKTNPRNQKSMNLTLIYGEIEDWRKGDIFENVNHDFTKIKTEIELTNDSTMKLNTKRR